MSQYLNLLRSTARNGVVASCKATKRKSAARPWCYPSATHCPTWYQSGDSPHHRSSYRQYSQGTDRSVATSYNSTYSLGTSDNDDIPLRNKNHIDMAAGPYRHRAAARQWDAGARGQGWGQQGYPAAGPLGTLVTKRHLSMPNLPQRPTETPPPMPPHPDSSGTLKRHPFGPGLLRPSEAELEAVNANNDAALKELEEEFKLYEKALKNPKKLAEDGQTALTVPTSSKVLGYVKKAPIFLKDIIVACARWLWTVMRNPSVLRQQAKEAKASLKHMLHHYKTGGKLLWSDIKTAKNILKSMLMGHPLTRRERKQLLRTTSDIFRMVPLAVFVIVPFMEFLLPFALKLFPNLLPSTFQDSLKKEEDMKKELRMRLALAGFLQDTLKEMAAKKTEDSEDSSAEGGAAGKQEASQKELQEFIEKARVGRVANEDIIRFARLFKDELMLDNMSRAQLSNMCRYMGLAPFGSDNFLRFQLRNHLRTIVQDDQRILWEGLGSLNRNELQEACRERGMRATGLTKEGYQRQLRNWLDLSVAKNVPISLLIMSRAFTLEAPDPTRALAQSISSMDNDVVTEVMIEAASHAEKLTPEYRSLKLESLERQNELIEAERKKQDEIKAKKKQKEEQVKQKDLEASQEKEKATKERAAAAAAEDQGASEQVKQAAQRGAEMTGGAEQGKRKEAVTTEADTVGKDLQAGDRTVGAKQEEEGKDKPKAELKKEGKDLTTEELRALESLTNRSSVERERAQLAMMKAKLEESIKAAREVSKEALKHHGHDEPAPEVKQAFAAAEVAKSKVEDALKAVEATGLQMGKATPKEVEEAKQNAEASLRGLGNLTEAPPGSTPGAPAQKKAEAPPPKAGGSAKVDKSVQRVQNKLASMLDKLEKDIETVEKRIGDRMHMLDRDTDGVVSADELAFVIQHVLSNETTTENAMDLVNKIDQDKDGQISVQELIEWVKKYSDSEAHEVFDELYNTQHPDEDADSPPQQSGAQGSEDSKKSEKSAS